MRAPNAKPIDRQLEPEICPKTSVSQIPVQANEGAQPSPRVDWLTAKEAASYLKIPTRTLLLWTRQGKVQAFALSGTKRRVWRYRRDDLDRLLLNHPVLSSESLSVLSERRLQ